MKLRDLLVEGELDARFRDDAQMEYDKLLFNIESLPINVVLGPTRELKQYEVGYFIQNACDFSDVMIVFTRPDYGRPGGHFYRADPQRERPMLVLYHEEDEKRLFTRNILASRNKLPNKIEAATKVLRRKHKTFIHEYVHEMDKARMGAYKYPDVEVKPTDSAEEKARKQAEYFNTPMELNAFMQSAMAMIEKDVRKRPKNWPMGTHDEFYFRAIRFVEKNFPTFYRNLTDENFRKLQKRLMQLWLDIRGSG